KYFITRGVTHVSDRPRKKVVLRKKRFGNSGRPTCSLEDGCDARVTKRVGLYYGAVNGKACDTLPSEFWTWIFTGCPADRNFNSFFAVRVFGSAGSCRVLTGCPLTRITAPASKL